MLCGEGLADRRGEYLGCFVRIVSKFGLYDMGVVSESETTNLFPRSKKVSTGPLVAVGARGDPEGRRGRGQDQRGGPLREHPRRA